MKTYLRRTVVLASLAGVAAPLFAQANTPQRLPQGVSATLQIAGQLPGSASADLASLLDAVSGGSTGQRFWEQAGQTVFVVPGPDLPMDSLAAITEDMTVMCRILDRATAPVLMTAGVVSGFDPYRSDPYGVYGGRTLDVRSRTQGLYLDGYGALFFVQVGLPLAAPPQEQEQPKTEQSADPLWSRTVDELKGVPQRRSQAAVQEYDAQKVEELKKILVKSLRHAANLRVHGPQDLVTVVITTRGAGGSSYAYATAQPQARTWSEPSVTDSSDVLVLRTAKSDVDAFAKDVLTLEQFSGKVQVLKSWTNAGQQATATPPMVELPSTGSSGRAGRRR